MSRQNAGARGHIPPTATVQLSSSYSAASDKHCAFSTVPLP